MLDVNKRWAAYRGPVYRGAYIRSARASARGELISTVCEPCDTTFLKALASASVMVTLNTPGSSITTIC